MSDDYFVFTTESLLTYIYENNFVCYSTFTVYFCIKVFNVFLLIKTAVLYGIYTTVQYIIDLQCTTDLEIFTIE